MKNIQALVKVAQWLEQGAPHVEVGPFEIGRFDMGESISVDDEWCGTACCIAGAVSQFEGLVHPDEALFAFGAPFFDTEGSVGLMTKVAIHLGIDDDTAAMLFVPWDHFSHDRESEFSDPARAAKVIRHFISTGVVDWDLFPFFEEKYKNLYFWKDS